MGGIGTVGSVGNMLAITHCHYNCAAEFLQKAVCSELHGVLNKFSSNEGNTLLFGLVISVYL